MKIWISECVTRDALLTALLHTPSTPQQRRSLRGVLESGEVAPVLAFLRARGWQVIGGSNCPEHPEEGLTLER